MTGRSATVWYGDEKLGALEEGDDGRLRLRYDDEWARTGFPVSVSLPITGRAVDAHAFFTGLLPEGASRRRISERLDIDERDDVGLLLAIGRDCAGALSVVPGELEPSDEAGEDPITSQELFWLVESHGQAIPGSAEQQRFSLAGAQEKLALWVEGDQLFLPSRTRPSTHILKFETTKQVCFAEYMAHDMARRLGLPVAPTEFLRLGDPPPTPYLRIERYDRSPDANGRTRRLHQEDVTQALGYSSAQKYEEDGGPTLGQVAALVRRVSDDPMADIAQLRDWQLFNYLVGNSDAHAKNISLLYPEAGAVPRLSPMYDLVAIEFLNRLGMHFDRKLAFSVGEHRLPEEITRRDWSELAKAIGVSANSLLERLKQLAEALPDAAIAARAELAAHIGDNPAYDKLEESIRDRTSWTLRSVFGRG